MDCFRSNFLNNNKPMLSTAPNIVARKNVSNTFFNPKTIPRTPNNFMSPAPIPPLLTRIINAIIPKPTSAPVMEEIHGVNGSMKRSRINKGRKNSSTLFGMIIYVKSDTHMIINIDIKRIATISSTCKPMRT